MLNILNKQKIFKRIIGKKYRKNEKISFTAKDKIINYIAANRTLPLFPIDDIKIKITHTHGHTIMYQEYYAESDDGYRPAGYIDKHTYIVDIIGTVKYIYKGKVIAIEEEKKITQIEPTYEEKIKYLKDEVNVEKLFAKYIEKAIERYKEKTKVLVYENKVAVVYNWETKYKAIYKIFKNVIDEYAKILQPYIEKYNELHKKEYKAKDEYMYKYEFKKEKLYGRMHLYQELRNILPNCHGIKAADKIMQILEKYKDKKVKEAHDAYWETRDKIGYSPIYVIPNPKYFPEDIVKELERIKAEAEKEYDETVLAKHRKEYEAKRDKLYEVLEAITGVKFEGWDDLEKARVLFDKLRDTKIYKAEYNRKKEGEFITRIDGKIFFIQNNNHIITGENYFVGVIKFEKPRFGVIIPIMQIDMDELGSILWMDLHNLFLPDKVIEMKKEAGLKVKE